MDCFIIKDPNHKVTQNRSHPLLNQLKNPGKNKSGFISNLSKQKLREQLLSTPSPLEELAETEYQKNIKQAEMDPIMRKALPHIDKMVLLHLTMLRNLDFEELVRFSMLSEIVDMGFIGTLCIPDKNIQDNLIISSGIYGVCLLSIKPFREEAGTYLLSFESAPGTISLINIDEEYNIKPVLSSEPWNPTSDESSLLQFFQNFSLCEFYNKWKNLKNLPIPEVNIIRVGNDIAEA